MNFEENVKVRHFSEDSEPYINTEKDLVLDFGDTSKHFQVNKFNSDGLDSTVNCSKNLQCITENDNEASMSAEQSSIQ
jgi:hypothetical protein